MTLAMLLNKLNGWQRAWIVIAIAWLIPVGFFGVRTAGDDNYVWRHYQLKSTDWGDSIDVYGQKFNANAPGLAVIIYDTGRLVSNGITNVTGATFDYKTEMLIGAFVLWAIPVLTLYVLGLSIAWVRAGFRKKLAM